jgi:hypothetical protein
MAWKTPEDKSRFFDDLERAFNTPPTRTLIIPQVSDIKLPKNTTETAAVKRRKSSDRGQEVKRKRSTSSENNIQLDTVINPPAAAERVTSHDPPSSVKRRPSETVSRRSTSDRVNEPPKKSSLLDGMVLYFIPNSKKNGLRKFRMTLFAEHGAEVRHEWSEDISHIICDKNITGERVLRDLRWEQFPVRPFTSWWLLIIRLGLL